MALITSKKVRSFTTQLIFAAGFAVVALIGITGHAKAAAPTCTFSWDSGTSTTGRGSCSFAPDSSNIGSQSLGITRYFGDTTIYFGNDTTVTRSTAATTGANQAVIGLNGATYYQTTCNSSAGAPAVSFAAGLSASFHFEIDHGDNGSCGSFSSASTTFTLTRPAPGGSGGTSNPPTISCTSATPYLASNQASTLTFTSTNATSIVARERNTGAIPFQNSGALPSPYTYTFYAGPYNSNTEVDFTATNSAGQAAYCTSYIYYAAPTIDASVTPSSITSGQVVTYNWNTTNATGQMSITGLPYQPVANSTWQSTTSTLTTVGTNTITFSVSGPGGSASKTVTVDVASAPKPGDFTVNNVTVSCFPLYDKPTTTISWNTSPGATSYTVAQNGANLSPTTGLSLSSAVSNGGTYSYTVTAFNSNGSVVGAPVISGANTITAPTCVAKLTVVLSPLSTTVSPGGTKVFSVQTALSSTNVSPRIVTPTGYRWTLADNLLGSISGTASSGTLSVSSSAALKSYPNVVSDVATFRLPDGTDVSGTGLASVQVAKPQIVGDVFSGGGVNGLALDANSVVSANGQIQNVSGTNLTIPNYAPSNSLDWNTARTAMQQEAAKLKAEQVSTSPGGSHWLSTGSFTLNGDFNLNPPPGHDYHYVGSVDTSKNEGSVWYVPGDLTIAGDTQLFGKGTILVGGNVTVKNGCIHYAGTDCATLTALHTASLGVVVLGSGSVTIDGSTTTMVGAYFVPTGNITFSSNSSSALAAAGLFVGNSITLSRSFATIEYDSAISQSPPPGFGVLSIPVVKAAKP